MSTKALNIVLLVALVASVGIQLALPPNAARQNPFWALSNMARTPRANAFAASDVLPGKLVNQPPVPGTLPYGAQPLHFAAGDAEALRAGKELANPFKADATTLARGEQVYATFCAPCHGGGLAGDGLVAQRGFPPPPSLLGDKQKAMPDGEYWHVLTFGRKNMPPYAAQVPSDDRWKAILYIRAQQAKAAVPAPAATPAPAAAAPAAAPAAKEAAPAAPAPAATPAAAPTPAAKEAKP